MDIAVDRNRNDFIEEKIMPYFEKKEFNKKE